MSLVPIGMESALFGMLVFLFGGILGFSLGIMFDLAKDQIKTKLVERRKKNQAKMNTRMELFDLLMVLQENFEARRIFALSKHMGLRFAIEVWLREQILMTLSKRIGAFDEIKVDSLPFSTQMIALCQRIIFTVNQGHSLDEITWCNKYDEHLEQHLTDLKLLIGTLNNCINGV